MCASPRMRTFALAPMVSAAFVGCTLLNALDHLQSGLGEDGAPKNGQPTGGAARDMAPSSDAAPLPGCPPERWSGCGVSIIAERARPAGVAFLKSGSSTLLYFTDEATGEISMATCSSGSCGAPTVRVSGENAPRSVGATSDSLFWTTPTAIRRLRPTSDANASVASLDGVSGDANLTVEYPYVAWTDDKGARGCSTVGPCDIKAVGVTPARSPAVAREQMIFFVADGAVKYTNWDSLNTIVMPGTAGAELVVRAMLYADPWQDRLGVVATLRHDGGSLMVVPDALDDAGAMLVLNTQAEAIRSVCAATSHVYWTTTSGELRRQGRDARTFTTALRGLSDDTIVAASADGLVAIADRAGGSVLIYAPP